MGVSVFRRAGSRGATDRRPALAHKTQMQGTLLDKQSRSTVAEAVRILRRPNNVTIAPRMTAIAGSGTDGSAPSAHWTWRCLLSAMSSGPASRSEFAMAQRASRIPKRIVSTKGHEFQRLCAPLHGASNGQTTCPDDIRTREPAFADAGSTLHYLSCPNSQSNVIDNPGSVLIVYRSCPV